MNCGPWSVPTLSGAPVRQNDDLRADENLDIACMRGLYYLCLYPYLANRR